MELRFFFIFHIFRPIVRHKRYTHVLPICSCYGNFTSPSRVSLDISSQIIGIYDSYRISKASIGRTLSFVPGREKVETRFFRILRQSDGSIISYRALYVRSSTVKPIRPIYNGWLRAFLLTYEPKLQSRSI